MGNARKLVGLGLAVAIAVALVVYVLLPKAGPTASNALVNPPQGPSGPVNHGPWHGRIAPPAPAVTPPQNQSQNQSGDDDHDVCGSRDSASHHSDHHGEGAEDGTACHDHDGHDDGGHGHHGEHDGHHGDDGRDEGGSARDEQDESPHHHG